jgi:predicted secreted protein
MAAPTTPISGIKLLTKVGSALIGAQTDATLSASQQLAELVTKDNFGWVSNLSGQQEWSVSHSGYVLDNSSEAFMSNQRASLTLTIPDGAGGTMDVVIPYLDSIDMSLEAGLADTGGLDRPLWRYVRPAQRSVSIDIEGSYLDPAGDTDGGAVYDHIWTAKEQSLRIPAVFTVAGNTFTSDIAPGDLEITAPADAEDATISVTFASDGPVANAGTSFDSSVQAILDAFFQESEVTMRMEMQDQGTPVSGSTAYEGNGYFTSIGISVAAGDPATMDAELAGNGALTRPIVA